MPGRRVDRAALYQSLRTRILTLDPSSVSLFPTTELPHVYGVVMDMVFPNGSATFVVMVDGTTSLYTSSGASIIGGGFHRSVVQAGRTLLAVAEARYAVRSIDAIARSVPSCGLASVGVCPPSTLNRPETGSSSIQQPRCRRVAAAERHRGYGDARRRSPLSCSADL